MYTRPARWTTATLSQPCYDFHIRPMRFQSQQRLHPLGHGALDGDLRLIFNFHHSGAGLTFQRKSRPGKCARSS